MMMMMTSPNEEKRKSWQMANDYSVIFHIYLDFAWETSNPINLELSSCRLVNDRRKEIKFWKTFFSILSQVFFAYLEPSWIFIVINWLSSTKSNLMLCKRRRENCRVVGKIPFFKLWVENRWNPFIIASFVSLLLCKMEVRPPHLS